MDRAYEKIYSNIIGHLAHDQWNLVVGSRAKQNCCQTQ